MEENNHDKVNVINMEEEKIKAASTSVPEAQEGIAPLSKLDDFILSNKIQLKRLAFEAPVTNSSLSSQEAGVDIHRIIKTVIFKDEKGVLYAVILRATKNVDRKTIKKLYNATDLQLVPRGEVLKNIGFPAGGVPPFGFEANFVIDSELSDDEAVYAGGGTTNSLFEIKVSEISRVVHPTKISVSK